MIPERIIVIGLGLIALCSCSLPTEPHVTRYAWNDSTGWQPNRVGQYVYIDPEYRFIESPYPRGLENVRALELEP